VSSIDLTEKPNLIERQKEGVQILSNPDKKYIMFYGGGRSGKTYLLCRFLIIRLLKYSLSKALVARKSFTDAKKTIWLETLLPMLRHLEVKGICKIKHHEGTAEFANGSILLLGGLQLHEIDKVLGIEYGTIFCNEVSEIPYDAVEQLLTRLTEKSKDKEGNPIIPKFVCDLNPTATNHWTYKLFIKGVDPIQEKYKENFNQHAKLKFIPQDNLENLDENYIETLKNLSPAKKQRFLFGEYGTFEGMVYPFDESLHVVEPFKIPDHWEKGRGIDFGFTHPFVCLWSAYDHENEIIYIYREWVHRQMTVKQHSAKIAEHSVMDSKEGLKHDNLPDNNRELSKLYKFTIADHAASDRATLEENGIKTDPANKEVGAGIDRLQELMSNENGKKVQFKVFRSCTNTINGFYSTLWKTSSGLVKDKEIRKEFDDETDVCRYLSMEWFPNKPQWQFMKITKDGVVGSQAQKRKVQERIIKNFQ
jgi:phage terminase large subunit